MKRPFITAKDPRLNKKFTRKNVAAVYGQGFIGAVLLLLFFSGITLSWRSVADMHRAMNIVKHTAYAQGSITNKSQVVARYSSSNLTYAFSPTSSSTHTTTEDVPLKTHNAYNIGDAVTVIYNGQDVSESYVNGLQPQVSGSRNGLILGIAFCLTSMALFYVATKRGKFRLKSYISSIMPNW